MTEQTPPQQQPRQPRQQPQDTEQSVRQPATSESTPEVFGDGSTREQQKQLVKEAEEANAETKKAADAEREARDS
jgi:hypothetical protein